MSSRNKILILRRASGKCGNVTTAVRLRNYLLENNIECEAHDPNYFNPKECNNYDGIIAIHAYHCASILKESSAPFIIIFGGTDLNEYSKDQKCLTLMSNVIYKAQNLVTFGSSMTNKIFYLWPNINRQRINEIPQEWHDNHRDCWLVIIGSKMDDGYFQEVSENIKRARGVLLLSEMPSCDVHAAMKDCLAVINSSQSEGMCSSILEAMDLFVPVVARDIPGNRDLIEDRVTGLLYKTPQEFLNAIEELINDHILKNNLVKNAKQQINKRHLCKEESKMYIEIVNNLLATNHKL